ncbi:hypothetical protein RF11_03456 [Thelohanellus kitauei]|uniref:Uncharacterized protein n=1 Tax=Thelohanellus kitauei TaxID=669202 RepID=A0A0C2M8M5_THEKT|nr:hypothetical protein RF11_03456 [Thelohanellus kitauei]
MIGKNYTAKNLTSFFIDHVSTTESAKLLPFFKDIFTKANPGIPTSCVYTSGIKTISSLKILSNNSFDNFYVNFADGNGFATKKSLMACTLWDTSRNFKFTHYELENPLNLDIHSLPSLKRNLKEFIDDRHDL